MNIAFATKLSCVLGRIFEQAIKIYIDDYCRGEYDMDIVIERIEEIKAAVDDPACTAMYPYSDPTVVAVLRAEIWETGSHIDTKLSSARISFNNENMNYSKYLLHVSTNIDDEIRYTKATQASLPVRYEQCINPAVEEYIKIAQEGMNMRVQWLEDLKRRKNAGESWVHEKSPLHY